MKSREIKITVSKLLKLDSTHSMPIMFGEHLNKDDSCNVHKIQNELTRVHKKAKNFEDKISN